MADLRIVLLAGFVPGFIALMVLALAWGAFTLVKKRRGAEGEKKSASGPLWAGALAVALAYPSADYAVIPEWRFWAADVTYRFLTVAAVALVVGVAAALIRGRSPRALAARVVIRAAGLGFAGWAILSGLHPHLISTPALWGWAVGGGVMLALVLEVQDAALLRARGLAGGAHLFVIAAALPPVLFLGGFASGATAAGALIAIATAGLIAGFVFKSFSLARGATTAFAVLAGAFVASGAGLAELPLSAAFLLLLAPLASAVLLLLPKSVLERRFVTALIAGAVTALPVAAAAGIASSARQASHAEEDPSWAEEYGY